LRLYAAVAAVRLGTLGFGAGAARMVDDGLDQFRAEGVLDPWRMVDMLSPEG
jgi:hypothetical protein